MDHLHDAYSGPKISGECEGDFFIEFVDLEALLGADGEVGLVLVETDKNDLVFLLLHHYYQLRIY